jgi:hypothetical protein
MYSIHSGTGTPPYPELHAGAALAPPSTYFFTVILSLSSARCFSKPFICLINHQHTTVYCHK